MVQETVSFTLKKKVGYSIFVPDFCNRALVSYSQGTGVDMSMMGTKEIWEVSPGHTLSFSSECDRYVEVLFYREKKEVKKRQLKNALAALKKLLLRSWSWKEANND